MSMRYNKLQPWQIFFVARKTFSAGVIARIFGKGATRIVYDYGQDPSCTEKRCKNPLEAIHMMFGMFCEVGRADVAQAGISYLQTAIEADDHPAVTELQPTIELEILKDYSAITDLQAAIDDGAPVDVVDDMRLAAVDEINRTFAKYVDVQRIRGQKA